MYDLACARKSHSGGTILARLKDANLPSCDVFCLVRNEKQGNEVRKYGGTPVELDLKDQEAVNQFIFDNKGEGNTFKFDPITWETREHSMLYETLVSSDRLSFTSSNSQYSLFPH